MTPLADYFAPVQWIVDLLHPVLLFFHDSVGVGWGTSILLLTVVVRALLAPLTVKQFKSMQAMVRIAPQLKEVQTKYKDDKARQQQEVMKFYAEHKVNPFASCLPLLAQMPFFIGLFYLLQSDLKSDICGQAALSAKTKPCAEIAGAMTGNEDFLFIADLTVKATGWVLAILIVMYITSQLLSSVLTPSTGDRNQRMIMYGLPFVFVLFVINFPTGLIVYWITTNLWTVSQQTALRKIMGAPKPPPLNPDGTRPGPFDEILKQFRKPPAEQPSNGGKGGKGGGEKPAPKRQAAAVSSGGGSSGKGSGSGSGSGGGGGGNGGGTPREPGAKPPPPPRKRAKKRSGRRR